MRERFEVTVLPQAERDAQHIFDWLYKRSSQGDETWYSAFLDALNTIAEQGEIFGLSPEAERMKRPIRQKLFRTPRGRTYRVLYEIEESTAFILHVRAPGQKLVDRKNQ